jgi:hypothetical protein
MALVSLALMLGIMLEGPRTNTRTVAVTVAVLFLGSACDILDPGDDECTSDPSPAFTHMFTDLTLVQSIVPLGTPSSGGEIKERHQVQVFAGQSTPVIAPAEARVEWVRHIRATSPPAPYEDDYWGVRVWFSCEVYAQLDHIRTPGERLRASISGNTNEGEKPARLMVFAAGEVIGHTGGFTPGPPNMPRGYAFDYAVYNSTHENVFVNMARYRTSNELANSLHSVCGGSYYSGSLRSDFYNALGYAGNSAAGDCRSASRDVAGAIAGGWFRVGSAERSDGWRLGIATEVDGSIRMAVHPFGGGGFSPIRTTGSVNLDPALATGSSPYCYTSGATEVWFQLSADGLRMSMQQRAGNCSGSPPTSYSMQWER